MRRFFIALLLSVLVFSGANAIELSQEVIDKAKSPENAFMVYKDGELFVSTDKTLTPVLEYLETNENMKDAFVFDRTVGKAEALLYVYGKARFVYGETMSIPAQKMLIRHRIQIKTSRLVGEILTPDNRDARPCDKAVEKIKKPKQAYELFTSGDADLN